MLNKEKELAAKKLARNIGKILKRLGISQRELARRSQISIATINDILTGKVKQPQWYHLYQIAVALGTTIDSLIASTEVEIVDNPEIRQIVEAMPLEAKLFFKLKEKIPPQNVELIIERMKLELKDLERKK
jgi:transcriptional regulator with XRE-family HTH domain